MRCKCCKEKFEVKYFNQKYCMEETDCIKAQIEYQKDKIAKADKKAWSVKKRETRPVLYPKKYKNYLQDEINKLARMIDSKFGYFTCIDCNKPFSKKIDGGHFNSVGNNAAIRFNLHNIHSQRVECNRNGHGSGMERHYLEGLVNRYGKEYADMVDTGLQKKYSHVGLKETEIAEKLKQVRQLIRNFDTFDLNSSISARTLFNKIIGIYI